MFTPVKPNPKCFYNDSSNRAGRQSDGGFFLNAEVCENGSPVEFQVIAQGEHKDDSRRSMDVRESFVGHVSVNKRGHKQDEQYRKHDKPGDFLFSCHDSISFISGGWRTRIHSLTDRASFGHILTQAPHPAHASGFLMIACLWMIKSILPITSFLQVLMHFQQAPQAEVFSSMCSV